MLWLAAVSSRKNIPNQKNILALDAIEKKGIMARPYILSPLTVATGRNKKFKVLDWMKARRKQCFFLNAPELGGTTTMVKSGDVLKTAVAGERCGTEQKKIGILFKLLSRKEGNFTKSIHGTVFQTFLDHNKSFSLLLLYLHLPYPPPKEKKTEPLLLLLLLKVSTSHSLIVSNTENVGWKEMNSFSFSRRAASPRLPFFFNL